MSLNIHIYPSPFKNESRILKITKSLAENRVFERILIVGVLEEGVCKSEYLDERRQVIRLPRTIGGSREGWVSKAIKAFEWNGRLLFALRGKKADCINCHSLSALPVCVILKFLCGAKLVYDTHELETESAGSHGPRKVLSKLVERSLIRFADVVIVVSGSISDWYRNTYRLSSVPVIRNVVSCPQIIPRGNDDYLRRKFRISGESTVFLYLGVLAGGRGVEILLDAFSRTKTDSHMIFMGYGNLVDKIKECERRFSNIHFHPAVPPEQIGKHLSGADVGVSLIENVCLSYYYSLPNKLFEYLSYGLPVLASSFPEMEKIIKENDCGWCARVEVEAITILLETLTREEIERKRNNAVECRCKYDWSFEEKILLDTYTNLFASKL